MENGHQGEKLKWLIAATGMTQTEFAASFGFKIRTLHFWIEQPIVSPRPNLRVKLANALHLTLAELDAKLLTGH
jgi:hypothetical protein